jgi:hypothetical protein
VLDEAFGVEAAEFGNEAPVLLHRSH